MRRGRMGALEFFSSLAPRGGPQVDDDDLIDDDHLVDMQELISRLNLEGLVERYATQHFVPISDRILTLNLDREVS